MSRQDILTHAGKISAELAQKKAQIEFEDYRKKSIYDLSEVESQFIESLEKAQKQIEAQKNK